MSTVRLEGLMSDVSGGWVRGRPRLGWIDCEGGLGRQMDDGEGCGTMHER